MPEASPPTNAVTVPSVRALATSSSVADVGAPLASCAKTQMFMVCVPRSVRVFAVSDDLEVLEEGDDLRVALAVVLDDGAGGAGLGLRDVDDLLAGAVPADRRDAEVGRGDG